MFTRSQYGAGRKDRLSQPLLGEEGPFYFKNVIFHPKNEILE